MASTFQPSQGFKLRQQEQIETCDQAAALARLDPAFSAPVAPLWLQYWGV